MNEILFGFDAKTGCWALRFNGTWQYFSSKESALSAVLEMMEEVERLEQDEVSGVR